MGLFPLRRDNCAEVVQVDVALAPGDAAGDVRHPRAHGITGAAARGGDIIERGVEGSRHQPRNIVRAAEGDIRLYAEDGTSINRFQWKLNTRGELALEADGSSHWFTMQEGGSCEAAGGTCVPLVPDACYIGSVGDATQYSCGGGVGVECCLPPSADNSCEAASDCQGLLPQFCRECADGSTSCAHFSCVENTCQVATCD